MIGKSIRLTAAGLAALSLGVLAALVAQVGFASPDHPILRSPDSLLAGEVDAAGLENLIARHKGRVVLINFWATWCVPCRAEFPGFSRLQKAHVSRGLQVIGISTDFGSAMSGVEKFLAEQKPGFPNYHRKTGGDDQDFIDAVDKGWGGELPFSLLYDRNGKKIKTLSGKHSYDEYEKEVRAALK